MERDYRNSFGNTVAAVDFKKLLPTERFSFPETRVTSFMLLGPFVMQTDGAFETEYFYEREKILDVDYLADDGGEAAIVPFGGASVKNNYYGRDFLKWRVTQPDGRVHYGDGTESFEDALYSTEQRNCVSYAAFYVDCGERSDAIISYVNSGSYLYLNGELIDKQAYGRVKGLDSIGHQVAVTFNKGRNLVIFKGRVGYIADGLDLSMSHCAILPIAARSGNLGITYPYTGTGVYFGEADAPRQMFPLFAGSFGGSGGGKLEYSATGYSESIDIPALADGAAEIVRLGVPSGAEKAKEAVNVRFSENGGAESKVEFTVNTSPYKKFDGTEHEFSDFHFDTTYHEEQRVYAMGAFHITSEMVKRLSEDPNFKAIISEVDYLHPFYCMYPDQREALKEMFVNGKAEADCFYNQPNDLTSSGEGLVRNLVYGQLYHRDVLGRIVPVFAPGDVFGHPNQMSQMCKKGGSTSAHWGKMVLGLDCLFHHVSPDGTDIIHNKGLNKENAMRLKVKHASASAWTWNDTEVYTRSGDTDWMKDTVNKTQFSYFSDMMDGVIADDKKTEETDGVTAIEYTSRDLTPHHAGVLLTRTDFKQANRLCENLCITAEKISAIAAFYGADYPEKALDKAWRQILCAQHHDSITGTNNEVSFVDLMIEYREAIELAAEIITNAIAFLASGVKLSSKELPVFVFNPLTSGRTDAAEVLLPKYAAEGYSLFDESGKEYKFTVQNGDYGKESVKAVFTPKTPALGYAIYYLKKSKAAKGAVKGADKVIENEFFKLTVDENLGGGIVSLYDKKNRHEVVNLKKDGPANRMVVLREVPYRQEEQHEYYTTGHKLYSDEFRAEVVSEKTDVYQRLYITVELDIVAKVRQEITLYKGVNYVDFKAVIEDYQFRDDLFTVTFPVNVKGAKPVYEDRFAPHICSTSHKKLSFQTHQSVMFSHCQVAPTVNWLDLGGTVKVAFQKGKIVNGDFNIGMTALIRADKPELVKAGNTLLQTLSKKAIPVTPYNDTACERFYKIAHFNEDLRNTDTRFVLSVEGIANEYETKLLDGLKPAKKEKFGETLKKDGAALLYASDCDNAWKKPIDVILIKAKDVEALNGYLACIDEQLAAGSVLTVKNAVFGSDPGLTEDYGVALFNKGTIACSVEPDNLMNMMLFHTAEFYGNKGVVTGNQQLIPEQKTHCFTYAIYPHAGDYRTAGVFKKANEYNNPVIAAAGFESGKNAVLPEKKSFIKCDDDEFVITSIKAGGYPMASMKGKKESIFERGLAIRGFEPNGVTANPKISFDFGIGGVKGVNLLEEDETGVKSRQSSFAPTVASHSIETFVVDIPDSFDKIGACALGAEKEPVEPTYIRSWEHDLGTMPMGYFGFVGAISKKVEKSDDVTYNFNVYFINNHPDITVNGKAKLELPQGFTANMTAFDYSVEADGMQCFDVTVKKPAADAKGIMRLNFAYDGQEFEDIYEFGCFKPDLDLKIDEDEVIVTVYNHTNERVDGELSLATPYETWEYGLYNNSAMGNIGPRTIKVDIAPNSTKEYKFDVKFYDETVENAFWAVAKLMVNGRIMFGYDQKFGPQHNHRAWDFFMKFNMDRHSISEFLEK